MALKISVAGHWSLHRSRLQGEGNIRFGITGATGQLGRLVVAQLKTRVPGTDIVALVRSVPKAGDPGVTAREADYTKPETLERALAGLDTVLLISSTEVGQRAAQHRNVIEAARRTGVKRMTYISLLHADISPLSLAGEHLATEAKLKGAGMSYTILRNGWYTENYTAAIPAALFHGAVLAAPTMARSHPRHGRTSPRRRSSCFSVKDMTGKLMSSRATMCGH